MRSWFGFVSYSLLQIDSIISQNFYFVLKYIVFNEWNIPNNQLIFQLGGATLDTGAVYSNAKKRGWNQRI